MNRHIILVALLALVHASARADSYDPWSDQRIVSPNGNYYVVMRRTGGPKVFGEWGPVEYLIAQRHPDSPPVEPAHCDVEESVPFEFDQEKGGVRYVIRPNHMVALLERDKVLGRGALKRPPWKIIVSDAGLGFVGLDVYGDNYAYYEAGLMAPNAAILVKASGKVLHQKRLVDLFPSNELDDFNTSAGGMFNESAKQVVVVGVTSDRRPDRYLVKYIDWETGRVTSGPTQDSLDAVKHLRREHLERGE